MSRESENSVQPEEHLVDHLLGYQSMQIAWKRKINATSCHKQPPEVFLEALKNSDARSLQLYLKNALAQVILVNFAKFLRKSFIQNTSERLLLYYFSTETKKSETINDSPILKHIFKCLVVFFRSSRPEVFCKKGVLKNFLEGLRPETLSKRGSGTGVFLWILQNL